MGTIFCGIDWAERHHDIAVVDDTGGLLAKRRVTDDAAGFTEILTLLAEHAVARGGTGEFVAVDIAIETDRGLLVAGLRAAGHTVFAVNPKAVSRYRDRYAVSGAKSDPGDALVLANLLRTDRAVHSPLPADSELAGSIKVLARAQSDAVGERVRIANRLRSLLREFFPAALQAFPDLTTKTALAVLTAAPTPTLAARLSRANLTDLLVTAGRGARLAEAARLAEVFAAEQLHQPALIEEAMGEAVRSLLRSVTAVNESLAALTKALDASFNKHPDAEIIDSLPGLGLILGARVLGEFGDDRSRFPDPASRRNYAGTSPITRASGKGRVVLARFVRNNRLNDACYLWAFSSLTRSPGARAYYDRRRAAGDNHAAALRRLGSKLLNQLDHCLRTHSPYNETVAWPQPQDQQAAA